MTFCSVVLSDVLAANFSNYRYISGIDANYKFPLGTVEIVVWKLFYNNKIHKLEQKVLWKICC